MLKTFKKFFKQPKSVDPQIIPASSHNLQPTKISSGARRIIDVLGSKGYEAYVVGGCVRDLLLGLTPKDFDVATNATPNQIKDLFKRSRIIGRRFQIVHVRMGPEVIEVTTFRDSHENPGKRSQHESQRSSKGLLLRDNIFGTIDQDAVRRDFTINALYYHPQDNTLYDYANGLVDIKNRIIRIIGNPEIRYREDPVRMLRAVRFSAKLGFAIEQKTASSINSLAHLITEVPPARLFDESLKILLNGHALAGYTLLEQHQLFTLLFPETAKLLDKSQIRELLEQALVNTDKRIRTNMRVTPAFIFAALLWPVVTKYQEIYLQQGDTPAYALNKAASKALSEQCLIIAIPKRFTLVMREIWDLQLRLPNRSGSRAYKLLETPRFRAAYDFLLLREQSGEITPGLGDWWTTFQAVDAEKQQQMVASISKDKNPRKRRRRKSRNQQKAIGNE